MLESIGSRKSNKSYRSYKGRIEESWTVTQATKSYAWDCPLKTRIQGRNGAGSSGRTISVDANALQMRFSSTWTKSQSSYNSAQERVDEWNSYYW